MQLHACLFLFLFTAETLASDQPCDGHVSLDQEPAGDVRLSLPGLFNDTSPRNQQLLNCTWVLDVPLGATVLLKLVWLDSGSRVWLRCVWSEDDQALERGTTALLSGCDGNKTTIIWTGAGRSSDSVHLSYYVQENERNSSEGPSTQDPSGWPETGTVKNIPTDAQGEVKSSEEGRSPLYEDLVWTSGSQFVSSGSAQDERPLSTTSPQHRLPVAGRADRETLPLPEEKWNNGADTSGASHLTSDPTSAGTLPYFQHAVSTDVESQTENPLAQTTSWTESTVSRSIILPGGDSLKSASTDEYTHAQTDLRGSSPDVPLTVSPSETPTWGRHTISLPHGGAITQTPEDDQALPWSDLTTTSDPLESSTQPPQQDSVTQNQPTVFSSSSSSHAPSRTQSPSTHVTGLDAAVGPEGAGQGDSFITDVTARITAPESSDATFENTDVLHALAPSTESQTNSPESTEMLTHSLLTQTLREGMQTDSYSDTNTIGSSSDKDEGQTSVFRAAQTRQTEHSTAAGSTRETYTLPFTHTDSAATDSPTPSHTAQTHSGSPHTTSSSSVPEVSTHTESVNHKTKPGSSQTSRSSHKHQLLPSTNIPTYEQPLVSISTAFTSLSSTIKSDQGEESEKRDDEFFPSSTTKPAPTSGPPLHPIRQNHLALTPSALTSAPSWSSTRSPMFYIVPNRPATIRVESVELLLQIVVEESSSALIPGLEEDTAAWVLPYLQRAPGFSRLLGVWSSGHAVQSLVVFKTGGALQWLGATEPASLLELTGLAQAVHEGRMFRSSKITNITLGGLQGDVCDWLLQCPAGYNCIPEPGTTNHSCSSVCRFDFCHHHGICTHHPGQLPVCRCLVGDDFWYMGQRCDVRMTRAHLVGACLAILLIIVTVIGILAFVAVQRYRAILIQAKVDQTRSSYRRFNHFDELSGRFWLRSWAGSADSLDNPAFTRSDELLHLRALDRPCCYHDDTLSLASTCPSHGARINTIYPHSSQYGWRGSGVSAGDGVLDSGKASDLSVCSWPVEPIHWTPFPLLQQLSSHRKHAQVRVSRPRSYCEGMELVDLGKSWTA